MDCDFPRCPQWSEDECIGARNVSNEIHCFDGGTPGTYSAHNFRHVW